MSEGAPQPKPVFSPGIERRLAAGELRKRIHPQAAATPHYCIITEEPCQPPKKLNDVAGARATQLHASETGRKDGVDVQPESLGEQCLLGAEG
jgi:hypothetical protein